MPKGISETDVHEAADALVAQGERPTVERIRSHLGTGSPNTVTRWLETWWQRLDERLRARPPGLAAGNPPTDVAALAKQWWEVAVTHAHTVASQTLADAHAALQARTDTLTVSEAKIASERLAWAAERTDLIHARDLAQRGVSDLESHLQALGRHLDELQRQHAQVGKERESLLGQLTATQKSANAAAVASAAERTERELVHRATEDRWMQEIDRVREEVKLLEQAKNLQLKKHLAREAAMLRQLEEAKSSLGNAMNALSHQRGRTEALEQQVYSLRGSRTPPAEATASNESGTDGAIRGRAKSRRSLPPRTPAKK